MDVVSALIYLFNILELNRGFIFFIYLTANMFFLMINKEYS